jgi:hypothetical protein
LTRSAYRVARRAAEVNAGALLTLIAAPRADLRLTEGLTGGCGG